MISLNSFLVGAVLASVASAAALDPPPYDDPPYDPAYDQPYYPPPPPRNSTHCYTIWEDGYRDYVPTYYETYVRESTSILTMTTGTQPSTTPFLSLEKETSIIIYVTLTPK